MFVLIDLFDMRLLGSIISCRRKLGTFLNFTAAFSINCYNRKKTLGSTEIFAFSYCTVTILYMLTCLKLRLQNCCLVISVLLSSSFFSIFLFSRFRNLK